ncbi:alpha/beta hydrolase family protein [Butyrivibrio sp. VCD2006]|uniref:alpha/beta hydrolase family protein n=1 Tax=Butyrivibrio sp. VCD2006 TaxID=1280664 RepID=UPI00040796CC|nr:dienelactone hydrolase family protein [Butyrivibrio sp. VCD2006]
MTIFLFAVLMITEIGFVVFEATKNPVKKEWSVSRIVENSAQLLIYLAMILLPGIDFSFRFKGLFIILIIRIVVAGIIALLTRKNENKKSKVAIFFSAVLSAVLFIMSLIPAFIFTDYNGRPLTGKYEVAQKEAILIDSSRVETFETDGSYREVPVHFYYPENYINENGEESMHTLPLIVFSHGAFGYYQSNTSTYMELASNGYVVVSLDHPYHSFYTKDSDGKLITVDQTFVQTAMSVGNDPDAHYTEEEIYEVTSEWMKLRMDDMNFVVDTLKEGASGNYGDSWCFASGKEAEIKEAVSLIDTSKIGLIGHSLGGATAVTVGRREDVGAVVDLDGTMLGEEIGVENGMPVINEERYTTPLLCITNEPHHLEAAEAGKLSYSYANNVILNNADEGFETYVAGSEHMDYTDLPLFSPFLAGLLGKGSVDSGYCIDITNSLVRDFFNCYLKGEGTFTVQESY